MSDRKRSHKEDSSVDIKIVKTDPADAPQQLINAEDEAIRALKKRKSDGEKLTKMELQAIKDGRIRSEFFGEGEIDSKKYEWGAKKVKTEGDDSQEKEKPNFGLSGALAGDKTTGNVKNGVVMKFSEPLDAAQPEREWRLYVFKGDDNVATLRIHRQTHYVFGRDDRVVDVIIEHPSASKQHAVIQHRNIEIPNENPFLPPSFENRPYLIDLGSANKTFLNKKEIDDSRYYELRAKDVIQFGGSKREYILMDAN